MQPGENWPSPYNDPGAPPPTGVSTPSSEGQPLSYHSPYNDPGAPPPTGVSTPSSHHSQSSGGRRLRSPLSPNQPSTTRIPSAQPELRSPSQTVQAQSVASGSRYVAPQQVLSHPTSTSQSIASRSQIPSQPNLPPGPNPERLPRRATVDPQIPYPLPAVAPGLDPYAAGSRSERIAAARQRRRQLTQPPPPPPLPQDPVAAGRALMGMNARQRREALTPLVLQYRAGGADIDTIRRATSLPKEEIERIFQDNQ